MPRVRRSRGHLGLLTLATLVAAWALAPFVIVALDAARSGHEFLGVSSYYPNDGLQYLAWARDAENGLIRNLYGSATDRAVFVHPMWSLSGFAMSVAGIGPAVVMAFWKVVSTVVLVAGCLRLVTRHIVRERTVSRGIAFTLACFGGLTPLAALLALLDLPGDAWGDFTRAAFELVPAVTLWDYAPLAIALGMMPFVFERIERLLDGERDRGFVLGTVLLATLVAWLHPWQGETLIAVSAGLLVWRWADRRRSGGCWQAPMLAPGSVLVVLAATSAPILYYLVLSRIDPGWAVAEHNNVGICLIPWPVFLCCVAPLFAIALLAGRRLLKDVACRPLLLWPVSTMLSVAVSRSGQYRAVDGLAIPVAVLAVKAWNGHLASPRARVAVGVGLLGALAPLAVFAVDAFERIETPAYRQYTELAVSDVRATHVAARHAGGEPIVAPIALGTAIPVLTDYSSWLGHQVWTPDLGHRWGSATSLFRGALTPVQARSLVQGSDSRALVEPCGWRGQLEPELAPLGFREIGVGCARVYVRAGRTST